MSLFLFFFFFFNDTATTEIYTLSYTTLFRSPAISQALHRRGHPGHADRDDVAAGEDRKSTRLNSSHMSISYAVFCLKKKKKKIKRYIVSNNRTKYICKSKSSVCQLCR